MMKYIKVIKEFTFPVDLKLVKFQKGTCLVKTDDRNGRNEYMAKNGDTVEIGVIENNMDYFCVLTTEEYSLEFINVEFYASMITDLCKTHNITSKAFLEMLCEELKIPTVFVIEYDIKESRTPHQPYHFPNLQPYCSQGVCSQCLGNPDGNCTSRSCPFKTNLYYKSNL